MACRKMKASSSAKPNRPHLLGDTSARPPGSGGRTRRRGESSSKGGNNTNYNSSSNTNNSTPVTAAKRCTMPPGVGERAAELLQQQLGRPFSEATASRLPKSDSIDSASVSYATIVNPLSGSTSGSVSDANANANAAGTSSGERLERLAQMATAVQSLPLGVGCSLPVSPHSPLLNGESSRNSNSISGVSLQLERRSSENSSDAPTPRAGTTEDSSSTGGNPIAPLYPVGGIDPPHASPAISPALSHHSINAQPQPHQQQYQQQQQHQQQQSGAHNAHALRIAIPEDTYCDPEQTSLEVPALQPSQFGKQSLSPYTLGVANFRSRSTSDTFHLRRPPSTVALRTAVQVPDTQQAESLTGCGYHREPPYPIPVASAASSGAPTPHTTPHATRGITPSSTFLRPSHEALNAGPPLSLFDPSTRLPLSNHLAAAANDRYSSAHSTNSSRSNLSSSFTSGISESGGYGLHCTRIKYIVRYSYVHE